MTLVVTVTDSDKIGLKEMMGVVRKNYLPKTILLLKNPESARDLARIAPYTLDMDVKEGRTTSLCLQGTKLHSSGQRPPGIGKPVVLIA